MISIVFAVKNEARLETNLESLDIAVRYTQMSPEQELSINSEVYNLALKQEMYILVREGSYSYNTNLMSDQFKKL